MLRKLVRLIARTIRALWPWVSRMIRLAFWLAITAISSIWVGVPLAVNRISDTWIQEATSMGLPLSYHAVLRTGAKIVASITLILGWLVLASLTVFIIRQLF